MAYRRIGPDEFRRPSTREKAKMAERCTTEIKTTNLPLAVTSKILDSIDFIGMVNNMVEWDSKQCRVSPGDAVKAMVMTPMMGGYRPAIENVAGHFRGHPVKLFFDTVEDWSDLDPDMLARTLTKLHFADSQKLFMATSAALRTVYGIKSRACHSDTTSVSVYGEYDVYDDDENAIVVSPDGDKIPDPMDSIHITRGYSKDHRPDLKQYMIGNVVQEDGVPLVSKPLDGNTADPKWNEMCLELLKEMLRQEHLIYVADSKLVNAKLINMMVGDGILFLSRCPVNFGDKLLEKTLMSVNPNDLRPIGKISDRKDAAERRILETEVVSDGAKLRAVIVETSTLKGKGEQAVEKQIASFRKALESFEREYSCEKDAVKAFERFRKKQSKSIVDVSAEYIHDLVESRPRGRPRRDGTDIRRSDRWTVDVKWEINAEKAESLRRREGYIMLLSNVPTVESDPDLGLTAEGLVRLYSNEWKVEGSFKTGKRPILVERLFMKDAGRADALVTVILISALVRAVIQLLLRRGLEELEDDMIPRCGYGVKRLQRNVTADFFVTSCANSLIHYDEATGTYRFQTDTADERVTGFLGLLGIPPDQLFD